MMSLIDDLARRFRVERLLRNSKGVAAVEFAMILPFMVTAYLGSVEVGNGIAVDGAGNAYVTGTTSSSQATFPVKVGPDAGQPGAGSPPTATPS